MAAHSIPIKVHGDHLEARRRVLEVEQRPTVKFSIAMCTYNGARFIEEQLASLSGQSLPPAELVICDDGSSDGTLAILDRFSKTAPFEVRVERNEQQLGVSANFLKAASLCRHDWIAFSDQDDVWDHAKFETIAELIAQRPTVLLVAHRAALVDEQLRPLGGLLHVPPARRLTIISRLDRNFWLYPYGFTMAFSARLVHEFPIHNRPVESFDRWIFILASALGEIAYLPQSLAQYRRHGTNYSQLQAPQPLSSAFLDPGMASEFAEEAHLVRELSRYFENCAPSMSVDADLIREAARVYRRIGGLLVRRSELCRPTLPVARRVRLYVEMVLSGAYDSHRRGGLGWRAGVKDAARAILH